MHRASILDEDASGKEADKDLLLLCCDYLRTLLGVSSHTSSGIGFSQRSILISGAISFRLGIRWISLLLFFSSTQAVESVEFYRIHALNDRAQRNHPAVLGAHSFALRCASPRTYEKYKGSSIR
jgi:hypothetical protein